MPEPGEKTKLRVHQIYLVSRHRTRERIYLAIADLFANRVPYPGSVTGHLEWEIRSATAASRRHISAAIPSISPSIMGSPAGLIIASSASAIGGLLMLLLRKKGNSSLEERSTTSSAGGGAAAYETRKAVDEYLQFHFGVDSDILPYSYGPKVSRMFACMRIIGNYMHCSCLNCLGSVYLSVRYMPCALMKMLINP